MKLLVTQKNDIFDFILDEELNPNDFKFTEEFLTKDEIVTFLKYKNTDYYFMFRSFSVSGYETEYSPGERSLIQEEHTRGGWKQFSTRVKRWLRNLKREMNAIDKWDAFKTELKAIPFALNSEDQDDKFSNDELKFISAKIESIKLEIGKLKMPEETIKQLNLKLDSLNEKADKLSRTDWKELFVGAMLGVMFNLALPPESTEIIWEIIRQAFKQYILP